MGGGGGQGGSPPAPRTCPDPENLCRVCVTGADHQSPPTPFGMSMTSRGQSPCKGEGVLVNIQGGGGVCVSIFWGGWRHAGNVQGSRPRPILIGSS